MRASIAAPHHGGEAGQQREADDDGPRIGSRLLPLPLGRAPRPRPLALVAPAPFAAALHRVQTVPTRRVATQQNHCFVR